MKRISSVLISAGALILVLLSGPPAFAQDRARLTAIDRVLKASSLSQKEQADVRDKSSSAISAGVPAEDVEVIVTRAANRGLDGGSIVRLLDLGVSAKREALPAAPVLNRIEQGLSRGISADRIGTATDRLAQKLAEARPVVDGLIRDGVQPGKSAERDAAITYAARALEQNMTRRDIESIGAAVQGRKGSLGLFSGAVDAATYFAGSGMSPGTASRLVERAVQKGYSTRDLDSLVKRVDGDMKRGNKPEDIAASWMEREGMQGERDMERREMQQEMKGGHGPGGGPSGMGGMGGRR